MEKIQELQGKKIALVGLGKSWFDFALTRSNGEQFDEIWVINAVANVIKHDRVFMMDPASRFLDSDDAGLQTNGMKEVLLDHEGPIYTCELDDRCPGLVEYPIKKIVEETNSHYLNNTVAYAIAFAYWHKVGSLHLFGIDFGYKGNLYFAEAGRACCEYWLANCMSAGIKVGVAASSYLLDTAVKPEEKLYGYHRLEDPLFVDFDFEKQKLKVKKKSEMNIKQYVPQPTLVGREDDKAEIKIKEMLEESHNEPKKW
tara:strand:+ start:7437 stop:8204 length:768 start_codon:yes stop_codon:yes gene_type:complete